MSNQEIVDKVADLVKERFSEDSSGHDWWHIYRVWHLSRTMAETEDVDVFVVELAALLHDIGDHKFHDDEKAGGKKTREILDSFEIDEGVIERVAYIVDNVSFKGGNEAEMKSEEGKIVQDADRLDAVGAIGVARAFAMGAKFNEAFYDPSVNVPKYGSPEEYTKAKGTAGRTVINHFYEKLLLLKDRMNTKAGREMAEHRHRFMEGYLEEFFAEWEGNK